MYRGANVSFQRPIVFHILLNTETNINVIYESPPPLGDPPFEDKQNIVLFYLISKEYHYIKFTMLYYWHCMNILISCMGSQSGIITGEGVEMTGGCHFYDYLIRLPLSQYLMYKYHKKSNQIFYYHKITTTQSVSYVKLYVINTFSCNWQ